MILILGAETYIGRIFCVELRRRGQDFMLPPMSDYRSFDTLLECVRKSKPEFVINATSFVSDGDTEATAREEVLHFNTILPRFIAQVCLITNTPWGHVSSCGIYSGAKIAVADGIIVEKRIGRKELIQMIAQSPADIRGFTEADEPNFSFRVGPCNYFSGTLALAEEVIRDVGRNYIWRIGHAFNECGEPQNFLQQILTGERIYNGLHAYSHTKDFVRASLNLWERGAPFGIYNIANPGMITTSQVVELIRKILNPSRNFEFWPDDLESLHHGNQALISNYVLDVSKLLATGISMPLVETAIEESLRSWRAENCGELRKVAA